MIRFLTKKLQFGTLFDIVLGMIKTAKKVLAVDDSEPVRKLVSLVLKAAGYEVTTASNGAEALQKFQQDYYDLVVTDMNMPVMHGLELIRSIRETNGDVPILALTSESETEIRRRGSEAGANGWVLKPFQPVQFIDLVAQVI